MFRAGMNVVDAEDENYPRLGTPLTLTRESAEQAAITIG